VTKTKSERVLCALYELLEQALPFDMGRARNDTLPAQIPRAGWFCLRDGDPGEPDVLLSPLTFIYEHVAELDIVVEGESGRRDEVFDKIKRLVGLVLAQDRTLGGECDYVEAEAPVPVDVPIEGGDALKAATIQLRLTYQTSDPLA